MKRGKKIPDAKPDTTAEEEARTAWDDVKTAYDAREALDRKLTRDMTAGRVMAALLGHIDKMPNLGDTALEMQRWLDKQGCYESLSDDELDAYAVVAVRATDALRRRLDGE